MTPTQALFVAALTALACGCSRPAEDRASSAPAPAADAAPAQGDVVVEASIADASSLLALLSTDAASHAVSNLVFNGLVRYDGEYNLVGDLAESWEVSPDGLVLTFRLRRGVRFHDGAPCTARDVRFTWEATMAPATLTAYRGNFEPVESVEAVDDHTVRVRYREPFSPALGTWDAHVLPRHLLEGTDINASPLGRRPVGTGPFRFRDWSTGQRIAVERNPEYFRGDDASGLPLPHLGGYLWRVIPDQAVQFNELLAGTIDRMTLKPLQWTRQTGNPEFEQRYRRYSHLANAYTYLGYNLRRPLFQDVRVRRALTHAIDKEEIVRGVLLGLGVAAEGPYKPGTWVHNPDVPRFPYDPARASALLAEAGWTDRDGDGVLDREGVPFRFTVLTNQGNDPRKRAAEIIQQRLAAVGVRMEIRILEWAAFVNDFVRPGNFDAVLLGWTVTPDPDLYDVWHSSRAAPGGLNHTGYRSDRVDDLLVRARRTFDREERRRLYGRVQEILAEDQPYTFLYFPEALVALSARVQGVKPAPAGLDHDLERWFVPLGRQRYAAVP